MDTHVTVEGRTRLHVPAGTDPDRAGPGVRGDGPFYNAAMAGTRDIAVLLAADLAAHRPGATVLDGLASGGARGIRIAAESDVGHVTCNDRDPRAVAAATRAVEANDLGDRVTVVHGDLNVTARSGRWHYVEVDPFGSPMPFLAATVGAVLPDGYLAVSATDTAALHGARRDAGRRRYLGEPPPRHAPGWHEAALRYLAGAVVRTAAQADIGATPVLTHTWDHCMRAVFRLRSGAGRADAALADVGPAVLCPTCQAWGLRADPCPCATGTPSGPYWLGDLHDGALVGRLLGRAAETVLAAPTPVQRLLSACATEAGFPPFYTDLHRGARVRKVANLPSTATVRERLAEAGYRSAPTHTDPHGLKSDAPPSVVLDALQGL